MRSPFSNKIIAFGFFLILGSITSFSQNPKSYFYENEIDLELPVKTNWSMDLGIGYRGLLQERLEGEKISGSGHEHLELNHFTNYLAKESLVLSLGLRYRFKEVFDASETDEFRFIEQVEIKPTNASLPLSHRFRLEQRFKEQTEHRIRYQLSYARPINESLQFEVGTEVLYAVSNRLKPEAEQRFSLGLENTSLRNLELEISFEYRMENYFRDLAHEFFIATGISYSLRSNPGNIRG